MSEPFAIAVDEPDALPAHQAEALAKSLAVVRRRWVERGLARSTFERAGFHRSVAYDREAGEVGMYLRAASRG